MAKLPWTNKDRARAHSQGWDIFDYDGTGLLEICKIDDPPAWEPPLGYTKSKFKWDEGAIASVRRRAKRGDKTAQRALAIHRHYRQMIADYREMSSLTYTSGGK